MDEPAFRHVIQRLEATGGADIVLIDGRLYYLTAEQLTSDTAPEAAREFLEERTDDQQ